MPLDHPLAGPLHLTVRGPVRSPHDYDLASKDLRLLGAGVAVVEIAP
jgi:hypothetical protein